MSVVDTYLATHEWGIVANNRTARHFRVGAKLRIIAIGHGRVRAKGLSIGGRQIDKWVKVSALGNYRAAWVPEQTRDRFWLCESKEVAAVVAKNLEDAAPLG